MRSEIKIQKGSKFYCETCKKSHAGEGFIYKGLTYCFEHFKNLRLAGQGEKK